MASMTEITFQRFLLLLKPVLFPDPTVVFYSLKQSCVVKAVLNRLLRYLIPWCEVPPHCGKLINFVEVDLIPLITIQCIFQVKASVMSLKAAIIPASISWIFDVVFGGSGHTSLFGAGHSSVIWDGALSINNRMWQFAARISASKCFSHSWKNIPVIQAFLFAW